MLKVFGLFSGGASSLIGLVEGMNHKKTYEVVGALTDNYSASGIEKLHARGIRILIFGYDSYCSRMDIEPAARESNRRFHADVSNLMRKFGPDTIALSGYMRIVPRDFLDEHPDTKNVHPMYLHYLAAPKDYGTSPVYCNLQDVGDMDPITVKTEFTTTVYERAFKGDSAVFDAIVFGVGSGQPIQIGSTVHRAIIPYDEGAIEVESAPIQIDADWVRKKVRSRSWEAVMGYSGKIQEELKAKGDVPAFRTAIELTAEKRLEHRDGAVYIDGKRMPYKGLQLTE